MNEYNKDNAALNDLLYPISNSYIEALTAFLSDELIGGEILELGVGTGRIALPLAEKGFSITGIDKSREMLDCLSRRDPRHSVNTVVADFECCLQDIIHGSFDCVLLLCNTVFAATNVNDQVKVFKNAQKLLNEEGIFVVETFNPFRYLGKETSQVSMREIAVETAVVEQFCVDSLSQMLHAVFLILRGDTAPMHFQQHLRLMTPREMDVVARLGGMELRHRMEWWDRRPAIATSSQIISVYEKGPESEDIS